MLSLIYANYKLILISFSVYKDPPPSKCLFFTSYWKANCPCGEAASKASQLTDTPSAVVFPGVAHALQPVLWSLCNKRTFLFFKKDVLKDNCIIKISDQSWSLLFTLMLCSVHGSTTDEQGFACSSHFNSSIPAFVGQRPHIFGNILICSTLSQCVQTLIDGYCNKIT